MATALETYLPFDAGAGANVTEAQWREMMRALHPDGPLITGLAIASWDGVLKPTIGAGRSVDVAAGRVWIAGHFGESTGTKNLLVPANATGSTRVDNIVARVDFVNNVIELDVVVGTTVAPALVQNSTVWEILLATTTTANGGSVVATITDARRCVGVAEGSFTPTFGNGTVGNTGLTGRYRRIHDVVHITIAVDIGSTTVLGSPHRFNLPVDPHAIHSPVGAGGVIGLAHEDYTTNRGFGFAEWPGPGASYVNVRDQDGTPWTNTYPAGISASANISVELAYQPVH